MAEARWVMPKAFVGMTVLWRQDAGDNRPAEAAIVTGVGTGSLSLSIAAKDSRALVVKGGVRHISDPQLRNVIAHDGVWDYTDWDKKLLAVLD